MHPTLFCPAFLHSHTFHILLHSSWVHARHVPSFPDLSVLSYILPPSWVILWSQTNHASFCTLPLLVPYRNTHTPCPTCAQPVPGGPLPPLAASLFLPKNACCFPLNDQHGVMRASGTAWIAITKWCSHMPLHFMTASLSNSNPGSNCCHTHGLPVLQSWVLKSYHNMCYIVLNSEVKWGSSMGFALL